MTAWIVWGCILLLLALFLLTPVGVEGAYRGEAVSLRARIGFLRIRLFLAKRRPKRTQEPRRKPQRAKTQKKEKKASLLEGVSLSLDDVKLFLRMLDSAMGRLRRGVTVHFLYLDILCGHEDAAQAALLFAKVNGVVSSSLPLLLRMVRVKKRQIYVRFDFTNFKTRVAFEIKLTIRVGTLLVTGWRMFWSLLRWYLSKQKTAKTQNKILEKAV